MATMKILLGSVFSLFLLLAAAPSQAYAPARHDAAHASELAALGQAEDPFAPVFVLMSRATFQSGLQSIGRNPKPRRDAVGSDLVLAEFRTHQLSDISQLVHEKEKRCGGYFAFKSAADADAFLRADRTAQAMTGKFLAAYTIDNQATVNPWLPQVAEANIRGTISHLSTTYPNRYYASSYGVTSATWIRDRWLALANGRSDVSAELFTACGNCSSQPSVILTIQGTDLPSEIVVLGGHLDSISNSGSGDAMNAPGADDDASGIASLTEVLRIAMASGWKPKRTVKFMGYAAEEVGLRGSSAIAQSFKTQGKNVVGVLQLDMTNYRAGSPYDMQLITDYSNAGVQQFLRDLFDTYLLPLGMSRSTYTCGYGCSDHASWTTAGFPSAMMYEGGDFNYLHTTNDTLAQMGNSAVPSIALAKLGLAFLGELGKTQGVVGPPPTGGVLSNGVPVSSLAATTGNALSYTMAVPANSSNLKFAMSGGTGNADLYVKFGSAPTDTSYDCRPYRAGSLESCSVAAPQVGTYYVRVKARTSFSGLKLTGSYSAGSGGGGTQDYTNSTPMAVPDLQTVNSSITVSGRTGNAPAGSQVYVNITHPRRGDLRIRLVAPDGSLYLLKQSSAGDTAANVVATYTVNLSAEVLNGTWKLRIADVASGSTGTLNNWKITF